MFDERVFCGKRILVTGATGFIGGRLTERLVLECGATVRALVSNFSNAARISRFSLEMVPGSVTSPVDVLKAAEGCDIIFHCAYGNRGTDEERRQVNVGGTENVLNAARQVKAARVVHVSTMIVYGTKVDGDLSELMPHSYSGSTYSDTKIDAEKLVLKYHQDHELPVVVIQPTAVYGPFAPSWTVNIIDNMKRQRMILINGGEGLANPVYIDDLVDALLLSACKSEAIGESFLISGGERITWLDFYQHYERMIGEPSTIQLSTSQAKAHYRRSLKRKFFLTELYRVMMEQPQIRGRLLNTYPLATLNAIRARVQKKFWKPSGEKVTASYCPNTGKNVAREKPIQLLNPVMIEFFSKKTNVRIDKARQLLSYAPRFDFNAGMKVTEQWVQWANLLPI